MFIATEIKNKKKILRPGWLGPDEWPDDAPAGQEEAPFFLPLPFSWVENINLLNYGYGS